MFFLKHDFALKIDMTLNDAPPKKKKEKKKKEKKYYNMEIY